MKPSAGVQGQGNGENLDEECILCGEEVRESENFVVGSSGFCHRRCIREAEVLATLSG